MDGSSADTLFYVYLAVAEDLLEFVSKNCKEERRVWEARKNFLVNLVTSLEVFCKGLILQLSTKWDERGMSELLQEKITLNQAFELISESKKQELVKEVFIINSYSFSNFESITLVFCKLTGKANLNKVLGKKIRHPNWEQSLGELFKHRNEILHDGKDQIFNPKDINQFKKVVTDYVEALVAYAN